MGKHKKSTASARSTLLPPLPKIPWTANQHAITWSLISEMERMENRKVLLGKKSDENSSSEHKISVCKRIAEAIIPDLYSRDATVAGERVRSKIVTLVSAYRELAVPIKSTGGGIENSQPDSSVEAGKPDMFSWIAEVPADGPGDKTSLQAKNIWQAAEQKWEFFPRMHRLLCGRPNVVPPAVTTGVGPRGASTVYYQAQPAMASTAPSTPSSPTPDSHIDPQLRDLDVNVDTQPQSPPVTETATVSVMSGSSQAAVATPSGKEKLSLAMQKASVSIKPLSNKKRSFEEQLVDITEKNMAMAKKRLDEERQEKRQKLSLRKREVLLEEFRAGLISRKEYRRTVYGIDESSTIALDTGLRSSPPLSDSENMPGQGVGGSDDIIGNGWEQ